MGMTDAKVTFNSNNELNLNDLLNPWCVIVIG